MVKEKNGSGDGRMFGNKGEADDNAKWLNDIPDDREYEVVPVKVGWPNEF